MSKPCLTTHCFLCCRETNMLLTNQDVERIQQVGFDTRFFMMQKNGWLQLKNNNGRCVFHNGEHCTIYEHRPEGCILYPVVYDKDRNCAIRDQECPQRTTFSLSTHVVHQLSQLVSTLGRERIERKRKRVRKFSNKVYKS
jgi:Fe-S-cluster containining protein